MQLYVYLRHMIYFRSYIQMKHFSSSNTLTHDLEYQLDII